MDNPWTVVLFVVVALVFVGIAIDSWQSRRHPIAVWFVVETRAKVSRVKRLWRVLDDGRTPITRELIRVTREPLVLEGTFRGQRLGPYGLWDGFGFEGRIVVTRGKLAAYEVLRLLAGSSAQELDFTEDKDEKGRPARR